MNQITRFALVCMLATLVVGLSACDELVSILSTSDLPQMEGVQGEIAIGMADDGMTDDGMVDDGMTDDGTTDDGMT